MSKSETIQRLKWLREALVEAISYDAKHNMGAWVYSPLDTLDTPTTIAYAASCGTCCCNAGWGGFHPALRAAGLVTTVEGPLESCSLRGKRLVDESSLAPFFGITELEAQILFSPEDFCYVDEARNALVEDIMPEDTGVDWMTLEKSIQLVSAIVERYET